jgi:beta-glucanase (GH16 family)
MFAVTTPKMHHARKRLCALALAFTVMMVAACEPGSAARAVADWGGGGESPYVPEGYRLVFEDNFNQLVLKEDVLPATAGEGGGARAWESYFAGWNARHLEGNNDQALKADGHYQGRGGKSLGDYGIELHEVTADGTLKLYGRETPDDLKDQFEFPYLAGMISGEKLHAQRYGYWEVRLRPSNISTGHHLAFWLIPSDHSWPPEIDLLEVIGSNPENPSDAGYFFFNSILSDPSDDEITRVTPPRGRDAWYTIGFRWDENDMRWYLDGEEVRRRASLQTDNELYFLISPEIGGHWVGSPTACTQWPIEAEIDYIRS